MSPAFDATSLRRLAFLYLAMAHRSDVSPSDAELEIITGMILARSGSDDRDAVRQIVAQAHDDYLSTEEVDGEARLIAETIRDTFDREQRRAVLEDLREIAESDGVIMKDEQGMLSALNATWEIESDVRDPASAKGSWGVLHDLAYIFLVLAESTDNELSDAEVQVMYERLREWQPGISADEVESVIKAAMNMYAEGDREDCLEAAIESIREVLPREQRMAVLNDLVKIANADGVFLDDEEDLINHLGTVWDVVTEGRR